MVIFLPNFKNIAKQHLIYQTLVRNNQNNTQKNFGLQMLLHNRTNISQNYSIIP